MKSELYYSWDRDDASLVFVTEAINLLANFKYESDEHYEKVHARVVINRHFTGEDIHSLDFWLRSLAERAQEKYEQEKADDAMYTATRTSVLQNADRAVEAGRELLRIFNEAQKPDGIGNTP